MNPALIITALGPVLGGAGWFLQVPWLFWIGVAICLMTLALNLASGILKLPLFPVLFVGITAFVVTPWYVGAGLGLVIWTALEAVGEVIGLRRERGN